MEGGDPTAGFTWPKRWGAVVVICILGLLGTQAPRAWLGFAGPGEQLLRRDRERNEQKSSLAEKLEELLNQTSEILHNDSQAKNLAQSPFPAGALLPTASVGSREKNAETHRKELSKLHNETIWHDPMSLFCFAVVVESEMPLIKWQYKHQVGIFKCTTWAVYSNGVEPMLIGELDGSKLLTTPIPGPNAIFGQSYFFGCNEPQRYIMNANVLMRAWEKMVAEGTAGLHSWIVKVDPDTFLSPDRLRQFLKKMPREDKMPGRYFKNCRVMNSMQGSLELLSRSAFYIFTGKKQGCQQKLDWWHMGEDIFTYKCLQQIGVEAADLSQGVIDSYCAKTTGCVGHQGQPNCSEPNAIAFHPLKGVDQLKTCWEEMQNARTQATVKA